MVNARNKSDAMTTEGGLPTTAMPGATRFTPLSQHGAVLAEKRDEVIALAGAHGMSNVRVFGSTARGTDRPDSDIDLLVDLEPTVSLFTLSRAELSLARLLGVEVDVVPSRSLKPWIAADILGEAQLL